MGCVQALKTVKKWRERPTPKAVTGGLGSREPGPEVGRVLEGQMAEKKRVAKKAAPKPAKAGRGKLRERALGPAADEFGKEIAPLGKDAGMVTRRVGAVLIRGLSGSVNGLERIVDWLREAISKRLETKTPDNIVEPDPRIAIPATQALMYSMSEELIREMFANLLAASMDRWRRHNAHPAFVEIIKAMGPIEAKLLNLIAEQQVIAFDVATPIFDKWEEFSEFFEKVPSESPGERAVALSNLQRMGIVEVEGRETMLLLDSDIPIKRRASIAQTSMWTLEQADKKAKKALNTRFGLYLTPMGRQFAEICLPKAAAHKIG